MVDTQRVLQVTRVTYVGDERTLWVYLPTSKLDSLVTSTVFSPPAEILEANAGGSVGHSQSEYLDWGTFVGDVRHVSSERDHYSKKYMSQNVAVSGGEPPMKVKELLMRLHENRVVRPVVRSIRVKRDGVDMLWVAVRHPRSQVIITADSEMPAVQELSGTTTTLDLVAASELNLDGEIYEETVSNAHDENFIERKIWPSLVKAKGNPVVSIREQVSMHPLEIPDAKYLQTWIIDRQGKTGNSHGAGTGDSPSDDDGDERNGWTIKPV